MKNLIATLALILLVYNNLTSQSVYTQDLKLFQADYVANHEVVKSQDKKYFRFFPIDPSYRVNGQFEKLNDGIGFTMKTSGAITKHYYKYGKIRFSIKDTTLQLTIYQSKDLMQTDKYKDYLFIPFTDLTTGEETYGSGRYLDLIIDSIKNNLLTLDFNKAYNPYCAYATGFRCPIPPEENYLPVAVMAGEKVFGKSIH